MGGVAERCFGVFSLLGSATTLFWPILIRLCRVPNTRVGRKRGPKSVRKSAGRCFPRAEAREEAPRSPFWCTRAVRWRKCVTRSVYPSAPHSLRFFFFFRLPNNGGPCESSISTPAHRKTLAQWFVDTTTTSTLLVLAMPDSTQQHTMEQHWFFNKNMAQKVMKCCVWYLTFLAL